MAVPISDESDDTVARVFIDRWVSVFGPPEQLLTDLGHNFASGVTEEMCRLIGTKMVFRSAYHLQTNIFIERYKRTLSTELRRHYWMKMTGISVCRWQCSDTTRRNMRPLE
jgi:transposase InsO family protein